MHKTIYLSLLLLPLLLFSYVTASSSDMTNSDLVFTNCELQSKSLESEEIKLTTANSAVKKKHRDLMPGVTARVNAQAGTIDLDIYETGETTVFIVDSHNKVVSEDYFYSGSYLPASIALPLTPGRYWIVIDADYIYAEGMFVR